jgi:hypothetical protein
MATMNVKDAAGATVAVEKPLPPGQAPAAASRPVVLPVDQFDMGPGTGGSKTLRVYIDRSQSEGSDYATANANTTTTMMKPASTGALGDFLASVLIVPQTTSPGSVAIKDGSNAPIIIFAGGPSSLSNLAAIPTPLGYTSRVGAWQLVLGLNVTAVGSGNFT